MSAHAAAQSLSGAAAATQSTLMQTSLPPSQPPQRSAAASFLDRAPPVPHHRVRFSHHHNQQHGTTKATQSSHNSIAAAANVVPLSSTRSQRTSPAKEAVREPVAETHASHKRRHKPHRKSRAHSSEHNSRRIDDKRTSRGRNIEKVSRRQDEEDEEPQGYLSLPAASASPDEAQEALLARRLQRTHTAQPTREASHPHASPPYNTGNESKRYAAGGYDEVPHSPSSRRGQNTSAAFSPSPVVGSGVRDRSRRSNRYLEDQSSLPSEVLYEASLHGPHEDSYSAARGGQRSRRALSPPPSTLHSAHSHRHHHHHRPSSVSSSSPSRGSVRGSKATHSRSHRSTRSRHHEKKKAKSKKRQSRERRHSHPRHHHSIASSSDRGSSRSRSSSEDRHTAYKSLIVTPRSTAALSRNENRAALPSKRATVYVRIHPARWRWRQLPHLYTRAGRDSTAMEHTHHHSTLPAPQDLVRQTYHEEECDEEEESDGEVDGGEVRVGGVSVKHTAIRDLLRAVQQCLPFMPGVTRRTSSHTSSTGYTSYPGSRHRHADEEGIAHGWLEIHRDDNAALRYFFPAHMPETLVLARDETLSDVLDIARLRGAHVAEGQLHICLHWREDDNEAAQRELRGATSASLVPRPRKQQQQTRDVGSETTRHARRIPAPPLERLAAAEDTALGYTKDVPSYAGSLLGKVSPAVSSLRASYHQYHYHAAAPPRPAWAQVTDVIEYDDNDESNTNNNNIDNKKSRSSSSRDDLRRPLHTKSDTASTSGRGNDTDDHDAPSSRSPPTRPWPYVYEGESQMSY